MELVTARKFTLRERSACMCQLKAELLTCEIILHFLALAFKVFGPQQTTPEKLLEEVCQKGPISCRDSEFPSRRGG